MEMGKFACAVLVAAASATAALAADAPAPGPGPASASFAVTPAVGAVIGASLLSFFAFYLQ
ncbi:arabinogalactan protein 23-like [Musa acuminata AAA Group]|uniref:arabinogalactan protein 23-like n=1 Tax=Musa acuminata AAA Group TaxID=214697 RepID=UPI0031D851C3